jgi:hypothetical protein
MPEGWGGFDKIAISDKFNKPPRQLRCQRDVAPPYLAKAGSFYLAELLQLNYINFFS